MQPPHPHSRINLADLKAQIVRKLGPDRSKQYFGYLNSLLSLKLSKVEFNKLCFRILGRDNLPLHNHFIRSILKNAFASKVPPQTQNLESLKQKSAVEYNEPAIGGSLQNGSHSNPTALTNGRILPLSPRKPRTGVRERRPADHLRSNVLGPNGKTSLASSQLLSVTTNSSGFNIATENGESTPRNKNLRVLQHHQGPVRQQQEENRSSSDSFALHVHNKELLGRQEEVSARNLVRAPLGIPFCQPSIGGSHRPPSTVPGGSQSIRSFKFGGLLDSVSLRDRMEQIVESQGLQGVSIDCANLLNNGLDAYLKKLIGSSFDLVGPRSSLNSAKNSKLINGFRQRGHDFQFQSSSNGSRSMEIPQCSNVSLLDFRVAMELNPRQLGEDWPSLLEKICTDSFGE